MSEVRINNVALSQNRLAHIESAPTLNEAQRMGLFDRVVDWLRGGVKHEAIKQAFDLLRAPGGQPAAPPAQHEGLLLHFNVLQNALRAEHADKCRLSVQRDDGAQTWSYRMEIDGQTLVSATGLAMKSGHTLAAFEDQALLADLGHYLQKDFGADGVDQREILREKFAAINAEHAHLAGDVASRATLEKFRLVSASLEQLGAPATRCFPAVQLSHDLDSAQLWVGNHLLGAYAISSQAVLTDTLSSLAQVSADAVDYMLRARDIKQAVLATVQDWADDPGERDIMETKLHDPFFCNSNFVDAKVLEADNSKFVATFRDKAPGGEERTLVFSNRAPTSYEFRGANLQHKLASGTFATLAELISQRFGTADDSQVPYLVTPTKIGLLNALSCLEYDPEVGGRFDLPDKAAVHDYFQGLKDHVLGPMTLGNTNLAELWHLDTTAYGSLSKQQPAQDHSPLASVEWPQPASAEQPPLEMALLATHKA